MQTAYISEAEAAKMLGGMAPRTLRRRVTGTGAYKDKERLKIKYTTIGKGYLYKADDILKVLEKSSS